MDPVTDDKGITMMEYATWQSLLGAPRVLTDDEVSTLMDLHTRISDREDPDAQIMGQLDD
jgi:hypothetical protein